MGQEISNFRGCWLGISWLKTKYHPSTDILRITKVPVKLWYLKTQNRNWYNFFAGFYLKFKLGKSTCFKVISQVFLDDAKAWSDSGKTMINSLLMNLQISQGKYILFWALIFFRYLYKIRLNCWFVMHAYKNILSEKFRFHNPILKKAAHNILCPALNWIWY